VDSTWPSVLLRVSRRIVQSIGLQQKGYQSLQYLNYLITMGVEYPEAEFRTTEQFRVRAEKLRKAYDNQ
jgi:hypothetical protein